MPFSLNSYERFTAWHFLTFVAITIATILMSGTGMLDSIGRQLWLLAVLLPFAGIPHGALDYKVAQDTLEHKMGKLWSVSFLTGLLYLAACINADILTASLRFTLTRSIPVTVATIGLAVIAYFVLAEASFDIVRLTQVIFIGIASVTYPHVAVIAVAQRRRILKYQAALLSNT